MHVTVPKGWGLSRLAAGQPSGVLIVLAVLVSLVMVDGEGVAADIFTGSPPTAEELNAPLYPGATFLRRLPTIDPYYINALYVTADEPPQVRKFYRDMLPGARMVQYINEGDWVWTFLLKEWIKIPAEPSRDDLLIFDAVPNVRIMPYQPDLYYYLLEYYRNAPDGKAQVAALDTARTVIRYTFEKIFDDTTPAMVLGVWRNVDRALPAFLGSRIEFRGDGTYRFTLTESNIEAIAESPAWLPGLGKRAADEIRAILTKHNPETGTYTAKVRMLVMEPETPLWGQEPPLFLGRERRSDEGIRRRDTAREEGARRDGYHEDPRQPRREPQPEPAVRTGLIEVRRMTLTLQFVNMPRLTFVHMK